jgi:hypothetical protein
MYPMAHEAASFTVGSNSSRQGTKVSRALLSTTACTEWRGRGRGRGRREEKGRREEFGRKDEKGEGNRRDEKRRGHSRGRKGIGEEIGEVRGRDIMGLKLYLFEIQRHCNPKY